MTLIYIGKFNQCLSIESVSIFSITGLTSQLKVFSSKNYQRFQ